MPFYYSSSSWFSSASSACCPLDVQLLNSNPACNYSIIVTHFHTGHCAWTLSKSFTRPFAERNHRHMLGSDDDDDDSTNNRDRDLLDTLLPVDRERRNLLILILCSTAFTQFHNIHGEQLEPRRIDSGRDLCRTANKPLSMLYLKYSAPQSWSSAICLKSCTCRLVAWIQTDR